MQAQMQNRYSSLHPRLIRTICNNLLVNEKCSSFAKKYETLFPMFCIKKRYHPEINPSLILMKTERGDVASITLIDIVQHVDKINRIIRSCSMPLYIKATFVHINMLSEIDKRDGVYMVASIGERDYGGYISHGLGTVGAFIRHESDLAIIRGKEFFSLLLVERELMSHVLRLRRKPIICKRL